MSLRLFERLPLDLPPRPLVTAEKTYLFSDNQLMVQARLDAGVYAENDVVQVSVVVQRPRGHGARCAGFPFLTKEINNLLHAGGLGYEPPLNLWIQL